MRFPTNASIASTTRWRCRSTGHDVVAVLQHHHFDGALQAVPQTRCIFQRRVIVLERMQDQGGLAHIGDQLLHRLDQMAVLEDGAVRRHGTAGFRGTPGRSWPLNEFANSFVLDAVRIVVPKCEQVREPLVADEFE